MLTNQVFMSKTVRLMERKHAAGHGGNCYDLMERAGAVLVRQLLSALPEPPRLVWIFAGKGNNGGDGYVAARLLKEHGIAYRLFAIGNPHPGTEADAACENFKRAGGVIEQQLPEPGAARPDTVIDALLGTGIDSAPRAPFDEWILFINSIHAFTAAVDVPSGLNADSGVVPGACVKAQLTVCMLALKPGLLTGQGVDYCGKVVLEDLDCKPETEMNSLLQEAGQRPMQQCCYEDIRDFLPLRRPSSHKGDAGKVLIVGGAKGFGGAAILCSMAALRSGAGLVKVALDPINIPALNAACPEIMSADFTDDEILEQALGWADCVAIGPGLGLSERSHQLVRRIASAKVPLICDADALNIMAQDEIEITGNEHVLTPHPGEAGRLLKCSATEINRDRLGSAWKLYQHCGGCVLLKGAGSVICDGQRLNIIREGSPAMASGGMGDVLTGIIAAYMAQGLPPEKALLAAACVHGRAGSLAGLAGLIGTAASDLLPHIRSLTNGKQIALS